MYVEGKTYEVPFLGKKFLWIDGFICALDMANDVLINYLQYQYPPSSYISVYSLYYEKAISSVIFIYCE